MLNSGEKKKSGEKKTSGYVLGRSREWNLGNKLRKLGYIIFRSPQSKGGLPNVKVKPVDLIALKSGKKAIFIQASKYYSHITDAEKSELIHISNLAGAIPILAYTLETYNDKQRWRFKDARTFTEFQFK